VASTKQLQCRFCEWTTTLWCRSQSGKTRGPDHAWDRLRDHAQAFHPRDAKRAVGHAERREEA